MSTKKRRESTSEREIVSVSYKKNGVEIDLGKARYLISANDYSDGFYYPGKVLSEEEYEKLVNFHNLRKAKEYMYSLLASGRYTSFEIREKLRSKFSLSKYDVSRLVSEAKENGLVNDSAYALDYIVSKKEEGYGKRQILSKLAAKGIFGDMLKTPRIEEELSDFSFSVLRALEILEKRKKGALSYENRNEAVSFLMQRGFSREEAENGIDDYFATLGDEKMAELADERKNHITQECLKCYNSLARKALPCKKKENLFMTRLLSKGFSADEIEEIREEKDLHFHD